MDTQSPYSQLPYPRIQVEGENPVYAQAMLSNVGGRNSEMTAVSLYFYNNLITHRDEVLSKTFNEISRVEMHHLEIFGKLALKLGTDPRLWEQQNQRMIYWSPQYNSYPTQRQAILQNALQGELAAIEKYKQQAQTIRDKNIVDILRRIIIDEQRHVEIFKSLLLEKR